MKITAAFAAAVEKALAVHGDGPHDKILTVGDASEGWSFRLNPTKVMLEQIPPYSLAVSKSGWPAGVIGHDGGVLIAAGEVGSAEDSFIEWCKSEPVMETAK